MMTNNIKWLLSYEDGSVLANDFNLRFRVTHAVFDQAIPLEERDDWKIGIIFHRGEWGNFAYNIHASLDALCTELDPIGLKHGGKIMGAKIGDEALFSYESSLKILKESA